MLRPARRILTLGINYPPERTGISPYTGAMARGLVRLGYESHVLTAHPHYPEWKVAPGYGQWLRRETIDGVAVTRLRHYIPRSPVRLRRALSEISFGVRQALTAWGGPDVIVAVSPALLSTVICWVRGAITHPRTPFVVWVQDLYSLGLSETGQGNGSVGRLMRGIEGFLLRHADRVVVIHERFAKRVQSDFAIERDRITVIRNWNHLRPPVQVDRQMVRERHGWAPGEIVVLHAGNMGVKQGLVNVVDAAKVAASDGRPLRFVFLGGGGQRTQLQSRADGLSNVQFMAPLDNDDFNEALQAADILLVNELPGVSEMAVPSKLTSYFAAGRPILAATDPTGITAEEVHRANAGVVVPAGDPQALVNAAISLSSDEVRTERLGRNGRAYREQLLGESHALELFGSLLSRVINGDDSTASSYKAPNER